jgi:hypothetical protein
VRLRMRRLTRVATLSGVCPRVARVAVDVGRGPGAHRGLRDRSPVREPGTVLAASRSPSHHRVLLRRPLQFDAHSGPAGENARGEVTFATGERVGFRFDLGAVTCLAVSGKRASIGVNFQGLSQGPGEPHSAILFVEDNGGEGLDKLAIQDLGQGATAPSVCPGSLPAGLQLGPTYPRMFTDDGTVTVTDAPSPLPTSKDQCKNGGWAQFGFKNQGQCVAFVRRGPTP